jgi:AcrR family transcriptional regulator
VIAAADAPLTPLTRGHKKKSRTRLQLLDAALEVLAEQGEGCSIGDVAARAGVSHGTFYNYFRDRDELLDALVAHTVERFSAVAAREVDEADPAERFARISARALASAVTAPSTVRVALRLEAAQRALLVDGPLAHLRADLAEGHRLGRFTVPADDATLDVVLGGLLLAARRVVDGDTDPGYRAAVIARVLMSLGLPADEADGIARWAVAAG